MTNPHQAMLNRFESLVLELHAHATAMTAEDKLDIKYKLRATGVKSYLEVHLLEYFRGEKT